MQRTYYFLLSSGLLSGSDLLRPRARSRRLRPVAPPELAFTIDLGDPADAVDSGWHRWQASDASRAA
jgi:hypothetical protein